MSKLATAAKESASAAKQNDERPYTTKITGEKRKHAQNPREKAVYIASNVGGPSIKKNMANAQMVGNRPMRESSR